jgi:hypothetical protein
MNEESNESAADRDAKLIALMNQIREVDEGTYKAMTSAAADEEDASYRCVRWGRNPETGERICLEWERV